MKRGLSSVALMGFLAVAEAQAIEIATGRMLGSGYDARSFYLREGAGAWKRTYAGPGFRAEAAGKLMNLRIAQGLFHDEWLTEFPFDPEENTDRLIQALDVYRDHGVLAINICLQGGNPGYNREVPDIRRERHYRLGPGRGAHISAFRPDGNLKPEWLGRLLRLQRALDRRGMVLNLMYFYLGQDEVLEHPEAIRAAVVNATDWLIEHDCRNVIIEIANEHDINGWDHERYVHEKMGDLIELARSRFAARRAPFRLPISASTGGSMRVFDGVRDHADLVIIHGNGRTAEEKRRRVAELAADPEMPGPVLMNEDDNGRDTTPVNLGKELASCRAVFESGGSWGYMPWRQVQMFPFAFYAPASDPRIEENMPVSRRDPVYFKAVLEAIRSLVFLKPEAR